MRRSLRSGLFGVLAAGLVGNMAVVGCSANGDTGDVSVSDDAGQDSGKGSSLPPPSDEDSGNTTGTTDSGKKDAGKDGSADAGKDSGPTYLNPGDVCPVVNKIYTRPCGKCGKQEALCQASPDAGTLPDGGTPGILSQYGACGSETGECEPGTTQACGNCGTQTCSNSCNWNSCSAQGQCSPGTVQHSTATCTTPNTFIERTCSGTCAWGNFNTTCTSPQMAVPATVGQVASTGWALAATQVAKHPSGFSASCPVTSLSTESPYFAVPVTNSTGKAAVVQLYNSGSSPLDTIIVVYNGATVPSTDDQLKACVKLADDCDALTDLCGNAANGGSSYDWAGLDDVSIPAGGTIMVITAGYSSSVTGDFTLNVKTKSLN